MIEKPGPPAETRGNCDRAFCRARLRCTRVIRTPILTLATTEVLTHRTRVAVDLLTNIAALGNQPLTVE